MIDFLYRFAVSCSGGGFFGFPTWYKYLNGNVEVVVDQATNQNVGTVCTPEIRSINDVWLIGAALLEILLRIAAIGAIIFLVWGGIQFISSQGEPDQVAKARSTVINALIGLVISVSATAIISFVAGRFV